MGEAHGKGGLGENQGLMMRIQMLVADQRGLDVQSLIEAIERHYTTPAGSPVRVHVAQGLYLDGAPEGTLLLKDAT